MKEQPLVSCIIIFYNAKKENFFEDAIASIFAQTYDNWELLLADDGSTDESTAIALEYARCHPEKIRHIEHEGHENRGMSATRNLGIRHARGEYIAFLDADDVWLPQKLEQQVALMEANPEAAMLYGRTQYWFSWLENNPTIWKMHPDDEPGDFLTITSKTFDKVINPPNQLLLFLENKEIYPCTCSILIRRWVFDELGFFEEGFRDAHEDMVFHSKVFLKAPVYVSSQCWDRYRMHPDSYWRTADREGRGEEVRFQGRLNYLNWLEQYLRKEGVKSPEVWTTFRRSVIPYRYPRVARMMTRFQRIKHKLSAHAKVMKRWLQTARCKGFTRPS